MMKTLVPLVLILLLSLSTLFISNSLRDQIEDLQSQIDAVALDGTYMVKASGDAFAVLNNNDTILLGRQDSIIEEVRRLGTNQNAIMTKVMVEEAE